jgi:tetratricopeptide (TPR) repeat protein
VASERSSDFPVERVARVQTVAELAGLLRQLRRREARERGDAELTYRELAAKTGWSHSVIGAYFAGGSLPPTDRFDVLLGLLGATPAETGMLATARDRVDERRRDVPPGEEGGAPVVPAQLPPDVAAFTGRAAELAELDRLRIDPAEGSAEPDAEPGGSRPVVISALSGTAGVGKTALALRWAHQVRAQFPDGQLYVNLRGYDPDQPLPAADALTGFLRALGVAAQDVPVDPDERASRYRTLLAGRQLLVLLDNAATVDQVRPLLPGTASCLVLVTSRDSLAGLVARDGARRLDLDLLPPAEAQALLRRLIGSRVDAEPAAAAALAGQCARLPLALRVAAELATARADAPLSELVQELADEQLRLDLLNAGGDLHTSVRMVFSWSYRNLPADAGRAFRLLGLHPGPELDRWAVAALIDASPGRTRALLDRLTRAHLVQRSGSGRYGMHDLLRAYATQLAGTVDAEAERRAALTRLFDHYLATAAAAMDTLHPAERHLRPQTARSGGPIAAPVADAATAQAWLDAERANLVATTAYAAAHGWASYATQLSRTLFRYLDSGGHYSEAVTVHNHALRAARDAGDQAAEAHALGDLGVVYSRQGRSDQAIDHHQQALTVARRLGERPGEARALGNLGIAYSHLGQLEQAAEHQRQVLGVFRDLGDRANEARALGNLGDVSWRLGQPERAVDYQR